MAVIACCCNPCPIVLEDLPTFSIGGWTAESWTVTDNCCAYMFLNPNECAGPTFTDGLDIDLNTRETSISFQSMAVLYDNQVLAGTQTDPPERLCPPCQTPFACRTNTQEESIKIATRYGMLSEPWRILMRICYVEVKCGEDPPAMKYVLESRYDYIIQPLFKKYYEASGSSGYISGGCCTGSESDSFSDAVPSVGPSDPAFWDYPSGFPECLDDINPQTISFSRYKIFDELSDIVGAQTFSNADIPNCLIDGILPPDTSEFCIETLGVSDPTFASTTIDCTPDPVISIDCSIKWLHPCNSLWYYVDPDTGTITCSPFAPRPVFPDTVCGPVTYTLKGFSPTCLGEFGVGFSNVSASCLSEPIPPCLGGWVRFASGWTNYTSYTVDTFCSGGTLGEICIPAPTWTVNVS